MAAIYNKALGGVVLSESSFEIVCRRLLGCDTMLANEVVTSDDETEASHSCAQTDTCGGGRAYCCFGPTHPCCRNQRLLAIPRKSVPTKVREKVRRRSVLTRPEDIGVSANVSDASYTVVAARRFLSLDGPVCSQFCTGTELMEDECQCIPLTARNRCGRRIKALATA